MRYVTADASREFKHNIIIDKKTHTHAHITVNNIVDKYNIIDRCPIYDLGVPT